MVPLDPVVQVLAGPYTHLLRLAARFQISHGSMRSGIGIQGDFGGDPLLLYRLAQERFGGVHVASPAQVEINSFPVFVDRSIQVYRFRCSSLYHVESHCFASARRSFFHGRAGTSCPDTGLYGSGANSHSKT
jgi:hypothetical protein